MKKTHLLLMLALCATLLASCSAGEPDVTQTQPVPSISPTNTPDENTVLPGLDDDIILPDGGRNDSTTREATGVTSMDKARRVIEQLEEELERLSEVEEAHVIIAGHKAAVALTFDDGPWPETTEQLLDGLAERGAKATFFLIGEQIAGHEDTVRRMADEGHQVGSHTFTHMDLSRGDPAERLREIAATDETLRALLGDGVYWLRPPWGFLAPQTAAAVEVPMVYWSLDTEDWRRLDADAVAQDIIDHARDGDIILLHDPYTTSVEAALRAIDALTPQGYRFVTLEELFRQKGVEPEPGKLYIRPDELKRIA